MLMRSICILTTRHHGDDNRVYHKEVKTLADAGYHVLFISPKNPNRGYKNVEYFEIPFVPRKELKPILKTVYNEITVKHQIDILHFQDPELLLFGLKVKRKTNIKVIYDVHEDYKSEMLLKRYLSKIKRYFYSLAVPFLEKRADKRFDAIVVADNFIKNNFSNKNTIILFNYPDIDKLGKTFEPDINKRKKYDIIFPGTTTPFIFQRLVDITKICRELGCPIKCIIIASDTYKTEREANYKYLETLGDFKDDVILHDKIPTEEIPLFLRESKIGVAPLPDNEKYRKNIATKIFEYMYYYLPVLTSDIPPEKQFIDGFENGYIFNPNNPEVFAKKIIELKNNPAISNSLGQNGHKLVVERWNWNSEKEKLINLYSKLLEEINNDN